MKAKRTIRRLLNSILGPLGLEIRRVRHGDRDTMRGTLEQAKRLGFQPKTVIDVGAATGTFELYEAFPKSRHILIEPLEENTPWLNTVVSRLENAECIIAAATERSGTVTINVHPDLDGSSLYLECEDSNVNGVPRVVPAITLDGVCDKRELRGPYLIKVDVQGAELDVLAGASQVLKHTEYVILEVCLFEFFRGGPQLHDIVTFMKERGFVVYDILGHKYRPLDGAMSQVDVAFVKESGQFRKHHFYATREQREAQNERFIRARADGA